MRDTRPWKYEPVPPKGECAVTSAAVSNADRSAWPYAIWAQSPPWALGESVALACREDVADTIVKAVNAYRGWGEMPETLVQRMNAEFASAMRDPDATEYDGMEAALRVAIDAMDYAMCQAHEQYLPPPVKELFDKVWLNGFIASVVSRLLHPKPKAPEERITIKEEDGRFSVYFDDRCNHREPTRQAAGIYRLGLIAQLKAESEKQP